MKPVRTASSNLVYRGGLRENAPDVFDLHCQRIQPGVIRSVWYLTPDERAAIANGANVALEVLGEPIQPSSLFVIEELGIGEDAPEILDRLDLLQRTPESER